MVSVVKMIFWILLVICVLSMQADTSHEAHYECGPHGKFEYCIDGVPGCVIGCHCHPGYYFDTDSKVCEPNIKLAQGYRRQYFEPTRIPKMTPKSYSSPTLRTTLNPIDKKVDAIARDTDDLGDWLYNQFFKTIENQVINKTDEEVPQARRSAVPVKPTSKKKMRKRSKAKKKKYKLHKGLRRKLLRITEDDSLFDSSSGSESSSYDSESETESESDSGSDTSKDQEHGHRKILMVNKKTRELPSFIFLPNVETPFYPPIGLPAPPVLPMYPMIPVPPVFPGPCNNNTTTSPDTTTKTSTTVSTTTTNSDTDEVTSETTNTEVTSDAPLRSNKQGVRNKLIKKLRHKLKKNNKQQPIMENGENFLDNPIMNDFQDLNLKGGQEEAYPQLAEVEDVDFKYLSQLIHKMDQNKSKSNMPFIEKSRGPINVMPIRRNIEINNMQEQYFSPQHNLRPLSKAEEVNDSYYTNLGRQIASLIRKEDSNGERPVNGEFESQRSLTPVEPIFNENSYMSHTYWERFVRSPMKNVQTYLESLRQHKHSNENLADLENQANVIAELERGLSLRELENIATMIREKRVRNINNINKDTFKTPSPKAKSFNVNLLPLLSIRNNLDRIKVTSKPLRIKPATSTIVKPLFNELIPFNNAPTRDPPPIYISPLHSPLPTHTPRIQAHLIQHPIKRISPIISPTKTSFKYMLPKNTYYNSVNRVNQPQPNRTLTQKNFQIDIIKINNYISKLLAQAQVHPTTLHRQVSKIVTNSNITRLAPFAHPQTKNYQQNPRFLNDKVTNINTIFQNQNSQSLPYSNPMSLSKDFNKDYGKSSYFHHEMHHFDYFDK